MGFPRTTTGAVSIINREMINLLAVTTTSHIGVATGVPREGFIRRIRATIGDGGTQPFELHLYEMDPEDEGTDGVHRIASYRVEEPNVDVFPDSTQYILDSSEEIYYNLAENAATDHTARRGTLYFTIKPIGGMSVLAGGKIRLDIEVAGGDL
tara:strand:- start:114 stop:572 length:459 start_codon:yes stop_codon:yes gene_type:complete